MKKHIYCKSLFVILLIGNIVSCSSDNEKDGYSYGSLEFEGQTYKTIKIGSQTWMADNLNYKAEGSRCYGEDGKVFDGSRLVILSTVEIQANCDKYGRLYDWVTAMDLPSDCYYPNTCADQVQLKHRGICPENWHLPSRDEWEQLMDFAGGIDKAGKKLKATSGWKDGGSGLGNGTDDYGFSALPGGRGNGVNIFADVGSEGVWWSSSHAVPTSAFVFEMYYHSQILYPTSAAKETLNSVRCLQD